MNQTKMRKDFLSSLCVGTVFMVAMGCAPKAGDTDKVNAQNFVQAGNRSVSREIGDKNVKFSVLGTQAFQSRITVGKILDERSPRFEQILTTQAELAPSTPDATSTQPSDETENKPIDEDSLVFGFPVQLLNKPMILGSVITEVSDRTHLNMGDLKLSDLPPFQVLPVVHKDGNNAFSIALLDCKSDCFKGATKQSLTEIPIIGWDEEKNELVLNLSKLGDELDLTAIREGDPNLIGYQPVSSKTVRFDFSDSTLVFDVQAKLMAKDPSSKETDPGLTYITNRWYLKPVTFFNPNFISRSPTPGVGFFTTERSYLNRIQRWDFDRKQPEEGIKYYIKHVPQEYQKAFAGAFDAWNEKLRPIIGKKIFSYEFLSEEDPRNQLLVTGDVRYNILEWDLVNLASYGGLGPSIAHPYTGEQCQASVLVQGPAILDIYTKWFQASAKASRLLADGKAIQAEKTMIEVNKEIQRHFTPFRSRKFKLNFGRGLPIHIRSQEPALEDPVITREQLDRVPEGYTFEKYMDGYFHDMLTHELGHNLGLRHNFKGNLGADSQSSGKVSRSIMEYLGRETRYLDDIGEYDLMAIAYGYQGVQPSHTDWYCTDEDLASLKDPSKSAECSKDDATEDPYSFFESRLSRAMDLLIARGNKFSPDWSTTELKPQLEQVFVGLGSYAVSAAQTSHQWTNFFQVPGRPTQANEIKSYVKASIYGIVCDPTLDQAAQNKETEEGRLKAAENLKQIRLEMAEILKPAFSAEELNCNTLL